MTGVYSFKSMIMIGIDCGKHAIVTDAEGQEHIPITD